MSDVSTGTAGKCPFHVSDYDHHSAEYAARPLEVAAELREAGLTYSTQHGGFYVLARHEDVRRATLDHEHLVSGRPVDLPQSGQLIPTRQMQGGVPDIPAESDPPLHTAYRRAMAPGFTAQAAAQSEERFRHWTTVCLDGVIETGRLDIINDLTAPVTFLFFFEMLGLPLEDWPRWREPIHRIVAAVSTSPETTQAFADDEANMFELRRLVDERRRSPRDDLITMFAQATGRDGALLSSPEVAALVRIVLLGAVDSVGSLHSQTLAYLEQHPQDRRRLIEDASLIPAANEEFLRYFSPAGPVGRTVSREVVLNGHTLQRGDRVQLQWLAANHDPDAFDDPARIILDRKPNNHLAFGAGIHKCIGLHFGRLEARILLEEVLKRLPDYEVITEETQPVEEIGLFSGYWSLPVRFTPSAPLQADRDPAATSGS
jgi:cytochrome P450